MTRVGLVVLAAALVGCGGATDAAVLGVDVAGCQPLENGAMMGFTLRADAPALESGPHYRCIVFSGTAERRVQLTVFADGFRPAMYLFDPAEAPRRVLIRSSPGPGVGVARASVALPRTGPYAAVVTAERGESGAFLISVQDTP